MDDLAALAAAVFFLDLGLIVVIPIVRAGLEAFGWLIRYWRS